MFGMVQQARAKFASLEGLASADVLCYICLLSDALLEGTMRYGRWLYACAPEAGASLDTLYEFWARSLMCAGRCRNWATCFVELGWSFTGMGRGVAMCNAFFWSLPDDGMYQRVFLLSCACAGRTWTKQSHALLAKWGLEDWLVRQVPTRTKDLCKQYVKSVVGAACGARMAAAARTHSIPVSHAELRSDPCHSQHVDLPWCSLMLQQSLGRIRAGLAEFAHLDGRRSTARRRRCIFSNMPTPSIHNHVLCTVIWSLRPGPSCAQ